MSAATAGFVAPDGAADLVAPATSHASFTQFFDEQWPDVLGYVTSLCGDRVLAEELSQEALTRVFVRWGLLREPRPYCFRIATNLVRDHAKRQRRETTAPDLRVVAQELGVDPHLLDVVQRLPKRQAEVVLLHYFVDLPLAEVAHIVRRPKGTVGRQLSEARAALAIALGGTSA